MSYRKMAIRLLKDHEGLRLKMYKCSEGYNTIGYGFNLDANSIPQEVADILLDRSISSTIYNCENYLYWTELTECRKAALVDLCYCVGPAGYAKFVKMHGALTEGNYREAAAQILDSRFAKQTGRRATELAKIMAG